MNAPRSREKWLECRADAPLTELARSAFTERLGLIMHYLPDAGRKQSAKVEAVHQLRVSTRRTSSALKVFSELLPRKRRRKMQRMLGDMRRAAADARDLDVAYLRLGPELVVCRDRAALRFLDFLLELRAKAQQPLIELRQDYPRKLIRRQRDLLVDSIAWQADKPEPTIAEAAQERLVPIIRSFFVAAGEDLTDPELMHQMRIAGKRLRYALELFGGAYDATLREELYPIFIDVQDHLGLVNDYVTLQARLKEWLPKADSTLKPFMRRLIREEREKHAIQVEQFFQWWSTDRVNDLHNRFVALLRQNGQVKELALMTD